MTGGNRHSRRAESLERQLPDVYQQLLQVRESLESHFRDVCDIEFTVQDGRLFILNARPAKRTPCANLKFALQFLSEGKIGITDVLDRVKLADVEDFIRPEIRNKSSLALLGRGLPACAGAATGEIVFDTSDAVRLARQGRAVILAKEEINPEDVEAIRASQGVLTARGGMTSHAALICRGWDKPGVVGFGQMKIGQQKSLVASDGHQVLGRGDWITIDGFTGDVYAGKGDVATWKWRDQPELVALASIIELALVSGDVSHGAIGQTWRMRDFFAHGVPLGRPVTSKRAVPSRSYVSFTPPNDQTLREVRLNLLPIRPEDRENYSQILLSLADSLSRQLSSTLGLGQHHLYFRPLWDPKACLLRRNDTEGTQLIGFEYFGINRHVPHLVDISTVTVFIEVELHGESDEWFLDLTNPEGESLVASSNKVQAYHLLINDAHVSYEDFPLLYDSLRRREYYWRFYEANHTSHQAIIAFLSTWANCAPARSPLSPLCFELGLIRRGRLTASGKSLIGKCSRKHEYEFITSE